MESTLRMPEFKHGMNIIVQPESFDLETLDLPQTNIDITKYEKFFVKEFEEDKTLIDEFNFAHGNLIHLEILENETLEKEIDFSDKKLENNINYLLIHAKKNSRLKLTLMKTGTGTYAGEDMRIIADEGATIEIVIIQNFDKKVVNFQKRRAITHKNSRVDLLEVLLGSSFTRSESKAFLNGEKSAISARTFFVGGEKQRYDIDMKSVHNGKKSESNLITNGVLHGSSQALSRGLITINKDAAGSKGYEKQDSLILSPQAEADAIPCLEIHNSHVTCSHGSSIGRIDPETLFYLMSRGLSLQEATITIIEGYFNPVLKSLSMDSQEKIRASILEELLHHEIK